MCCEICHLIAECQHPNFVPNYQPGNITQIGPGIVMGSRNYLTYYLWIGNEALTQGGEHHHEDALRAVHLQVLDGDPITPGLVRVGPRAAVTSLLRDLCGPSILVY